MDEFDLRMLREIGRDHILGWGSLDPRLTAADIAKRLGVARSTIGARLREWEARGFLRGFEAVPSPRLFGARAGIASVFVPDARQKRQLMERLALMDGLFGSLEHQGGWVGVGYMWEEDDALRRRRALVETQPGVEEVMPFEEWHLPPCEVQPSRLDWRILKALRDDALGPIHEAAVRAAVSVRTFRRRYQRLIDGGAVWLAPALDFARWDGPPLARLLIMPEKGATGRALDAALSPLAPLKMYINEPPRQGELDPQHPVDVMVPVPSVAALDDLVADVCAIQGVAGVEPLWPRRSHLYAHWFDERIRARIET